MTPWEAGGAVSLPEVQRAVAAAAGRQPGTLLLKNARVLNVFNLAVEETHVLVSGRLIAGVGDAYENAAADETLDLQGCHLAPGLIDGHVHIESSLVTPASYAQGVVPRGVTGVVCDPHEIGNVAGMPGINWLLDLSRNLPLDVWFTAPSCVPATSLETAGAEIGLTDIAELLAHPRVVGVAEIMSFPAVIAGDEQNLKKALLAERHGKTPEGHAPAVGGTELQAYLASGIASDHEATSEAEGREKLRHGAFLMVREGSVTRNFDALLPLLKLEHLDRIGFVTDDRLPHDLLDEGGVDFLVRRAIQAGVNPTLAVRFGSYNNARHYRLPRRGAVAPGFLADLIVLDDLAEFAAHAVFKEGVRVAEGGRLIAAQTAPVLDDAAVLDSVKLPRLDAATLKIDAPPHGLVRCIRPVPGQVLTRAQQVRPATLNGEVVADPAHDLAKLVCVERHGRNGKSSACLVTGFGLSRGALASTVGHDHHNLLAVGVTDDDIRAAAERLQSLGGGLVVVAGGSVLAELRLEYAGLVTASPLEQVRAGLDYLEAAARELGVTMPAPFMTLSFLGLAVIPELRLTDHGLVDVNTSRLVSAHVEDAP